MVKLNIIIASVHLNTFHECFAHLTFLMSLSSSGDAKFNHPTD